MKDRVLVGEAARLLGRSPDNVRWLERTGKLRAERIGHVRIFNRRDIEKLLEQRNTKRQRDRQEAVTIQNGDEKRV